MKLLERLLPVFRSAPSEDQQTSRELRVLRPRRFSISRGILDEIAYPLIDETDDLQVMHLAKFKRELESHYTRYNFFSICEVRDFMHAFRIPLTADTAQSYRLLEKLHCVHFDIMPARLYAKIPHLINHCISCGQITHPLLPGDTVIDA